MEGGWFAQSAFNRLVQDGTGHALNALLTPDVKHDDNNDDAKVEIEVIHDQRIYIEIFGACAAMQEAKPRATVDRTIVYSSEAIRQKTRRWHGLEG